MRIACCVPKVTNIHLDYVVLMAFFLLMLHVERVTFKKNIISPYIIL